MKTTDIAWLAGLWEGEGCFKVQTSGGYKGTVAIAVQMTDRDIIARVADLTAGTMWGPHGPYGQSKLPTYQTAIFGGKAAGWMMTVYTLLGERRQGRVRELLAMWKKQPLMPSVKPRATCHPDMPMSAFGLCSSCYMKQYHRDRRNAVSSWFRGV